MATFWHAFCDGLRQTTPLEALAVISGIMSVWYSKKTSVLTYPIGLVNTTIYIWLSLKGQLIGEAFVNVYYTLMSLYGWIIWMRKDDNKQLVVQVRFSNRNQIFGQFFFFLFFYGAIWSALTLLQQSFAPGAIPRLDAFASATAFTGMWLMARKKVESWYWWIATNIASIPLYFIKGYVFTSVYYTILLLIAFFGLMEWRKKAKAAA